MGLGNIPKRRMRFWGILESEVCVPLGLLRIHEANIRPLGVRNEQKRGKESHLFRRDFSDWHKKCCAPIKVVSRQESRVGFDASGALCDQELPSHQQNAV